MMLFSVANLHSPAYMYVSGVGSAQAAGLFSHKFLSRSFLCKAAVSAFKVLGQTEPSTLARTTWKANPSAESPSPNAPSFKNCRRYSSSDSPCRLMKVRMPVMVARSSIHGSSISRLLEPSPVCSSALLFPCHDRRLSTNLKNRQVLLSQDLLDSCLCAGLS